MYSYIYLYYKLNIDNNFKIVYSELLVVSSKITIKTMIYTGKRVDI